MNIVIIGSGNVAAVLGRKFKAAGHTIIQVVSRNSKAASELAYEWNTVSTNYKSPISNDADVYLIAVSDDAIDPVRLVENEAGQADCREHAADDKVSSVNASYEEHRRRGYQQHHGGSKVRNADDQKQQSGDPRSR